MRYPSVLRLGLAVALSASAAVCQSPFAPKVSGPLSQRVVAYQIDAKYNPPDHSVEATETLTYHNLTGQALDAFPFHLYLNAFQPQSTWMHEAHRDGNFRTSSLEEWKASDYGSNVVSSFEVVGMGDLTQQMKFIAPDEGNPDDKTVFQVKLPRPVPPGQDVTFKIKFKATFPEVIARTGYKRTFLLAGQWFPKVGVWWHGKWNCHQFHAMTEFFADFGTYDVKVTLPKDYIIGASGVQVSDQDNGNGTKTVGFHAEDVHDFAWTADPNFKVINATFDGSVGPVKIRLLSYDSHQRQWAPYIKCVQDSMKKFDEWYGPYPYAQLTVVDPPHGAGEAGGMEYPTFITGDSGWFIPKGVHLIDLVTEHEFGHQYWYGMVATNEFENGWLDEGINSYTEVKVLDSFYGPSASVINWMGGQLSERGLQRMGYLGSPDIDPLSKMSFRDVSGGVYANITYGKTATMLVTLEKIVGAQTLQRALHTYFMRYRFQHPTQEDFMNTVNEVAGQDLSWYWNQAVYGTQVMDYEVLRASSDPVKWWDSNLKEKKGETEYETQVILHRKGDFVFPIEAEVKFDNGESTIERWDGRDRWVRYVYHKKAQVSSVQIDPAYQATMDRDYVNNSHLTESQGGAAHKLGMYWMFFTQFFAQLMSWLA
jgi:Peptidase family M1 domain